VTVLSYELGITPSEVRDMSVDDVKDLLQYHVHRQAQWGPFNG